MGSTKILFGRLARHTRGRLSVQLTISCSAMALLAACSSGHRQSYAGEDTAYYLAHAQGNYAPPGPPSDPWGPYIRIASTRFDVPQMWIRQVMRVESGGHEYSDGQLLVSYAGAMGLMQLEPGTYQEMAERYGLPNDPFNPLDNILAGTAYIHEMYQIYGCPGFLAAYNAGPGRLDSYINYHRPLPLQTINYVEMIAPNIDGFYPRHRSSADELALNTEPMGYDGGILPRGFVPEAPTPAELSSPVEVASLSPAQSAYNNNGGPVTVPVSSIMPEVAQIESRQRLRSSAPVVQTASLVAPQPPVRRPVVQTASLVAPPPPIQAVQIQAPPPPAPAFVQTASLTLPPPPPVRVASNSSALYVPQPHVPQPPPPAPVERQVHVVVARATAMPQVPHPPYHTGFSLIPPAMASTPADVGFNSGQRSWGIQVGAYDTPSNAKAALGLAELSGAGVLHSAEPIVTRVTIHGGVMYRARFVGLQREEAVNACNRLSNGPTGCVILSPDEQS